MKFQQNIENSRAFMLAACHIGKLAGYLVLGVGVVAVFGLGAFFRGTNGDVLIPIGLLVFGAMLVIISKVGISLSAVRRRVDEILDLLRKGVMPTHN